MKRRAAPLLALLFLAQAPAEEAGRLFAARRFGDAEARYRLMLEQEPESRVVRYNLGTVLLWQRRYDEARPLLEDAARGTGQVAQAAQYNLGNVDLEPAFTSSRPEAERLRRAIASYKRALLLKPADTAAKWNLELARRLLEEQQSESPDPNPNPQSRGGGGGGSGGGGGGSDRRAADQDPQPQPGGAGGAQPSLSAEQAERILAAAEQREANLQQDKLRKPQPKQTSAH